MKHLVHHDKIIAFDLLNLSFLYYMVFFEAAGNFGFERCYRDKVYYLLLLLSLSSLLYLYLYTYIYIWESCHQATPLIR